MFFNFLYQTKVYLRSDLCVTIRMSEILLRVDLTDVTLADEDTNSILTDDAKRAIPGNMEIQVAPPGGQVFN